MFLQSLLIPSSIECPYIPERTFIWVMFVYMWTCSYAWKHYRYLIIWTFERLRNLSKLSYSMLSGSNPILIKRIICILSYMTQLSFTLQIEIYFRLKSWELGVEHETKHFTITSIDNTIFQCAILISTDQKSSTSMRKLYICIRNTYLNVLF